MGRDLVNPSIETLILADRAEALGNKLYLMGGYISTTFAQQFPASVQFGVALVIDIPAVMAGQMVHWTLSITDPFGNVLGQFSADSMAIRGPQADESESMKALLTIPSLTVTVPAAGELTVIATVGDADTRRVTLRVVHTGQ